MAEIVSIAEWTKRKFDEKAQRLFSSMNLNDTILARLMGVAAQPGTLESDRSPNNPNLIVEPSVGAKNDA